MLNVDFCMMNAESSLINAGSRWIAMDRDDRGGSHAR